MFSKMLSVFSPCPTNALARGMACASLALVTTALPHVASAEYLGLIGGREATPERSSKLSAELGIVTGELEGEDYQNIALRLNYLYTPQLVITGTIGVGELGESDGTPFGVGALYHLSNQRISDAIEIAGTASYHRGNYDLGITDGDINALALGLIVSGVKPIMQNGMAWYTSVGFQHVNVDVSALDSASDFGLGAGVLLPTGLGNAYLGFEYFDSLTIGLGIRYFVY